MSAHELPRVLVIEDGDEYSERFIRLLGARFQFERAGSFAELLTRVAQPGSAPVAALIFDLDFSRTPIEQLIDVDGARAPLAMAAQLAPVQGLVMLRALRQRGETWPALLCADLDNAAREQRLQEELTPLEISPSSESMTELAARLERLCQGARRGA
jgi:hypothetical protein